MSNGVIITWDHEQSATAVPELTVHVVERNTLGEVQDHMVNIPGSPEGGWVIAERRGFRQIRARCTLVEETLTSRSAKVSGLGSWLDKRGLKRLEFSDQTDRYWEAYLARAPSVAEWKAKGETTIVWSARPYAYSIDLSEMCVTANGGDDSGSLAIPDDVAACPVIEITPLDGTISLYTLGVDTSELVVSGGISSGATQTVSGCSFTITGGQYAEAELNGAYVASPIWTVDADGEFPLFPDDPGGTVAWTFVWSGTATAVRICFYWRRRYN